MFQKLIVKVALFSIVVQLFLPFNFQVGLGENGIPELRLNSLTASAVGDGTLGSPFTDLHSAYIASQQGGFTEGIYNFDISGNTFSSHIDTEGYVLIASADLDEVNTASGYTQVSAMTLQSDDILSSAIVGAMNPTELKFDSSSGVLVNMTTTDATTLTRFTNYETLSQITGDGRTSGTPGAIWVGGENIQADCTPVIISTLDKRIWHACGGVGNQLHWFPDTLNQDGFGDKKNDTEMNLWARDTSSSVAPGGASTNLNLWLKANDGTSSTINGATLASWTDASEGDIYSQGSGALQPTYQENVNNFNPVVRFDGVDDEFILNQDLFADNSTEYTFVGVYNTNKGVGTLVSSAFTINGADRGVTFTSGLPTGSGIGNNSAVVISNGNNAEVNNPSARSDANSFPMNQVHLATAYKSGTVGIIRKNGESLTVTGNGLHTSTDMDFSDVTYIGAGRDAVSPPTWTPYFRGDMAELIAYEDTLSVTEIQQVESYLALKYGITLSGTGYLNAGGSTVYDLTAGYSSDVFGIAHDDGSELDQRVSQSVNSENNLILATTQDFISENTDSGRTNLGDGNFLIMGDNGATINSFTNSFDGGVNNASDRIWKVQETGTVGNVYVGVPIAQIANMPSGGAPAIAISDDTTFDNTDSIISLSYDSINAMYYAEINPTDGDYISFVVSDIAISEPTYYRGSSSATGTDGVTSYPTYADFIADTNGTFTVFTNEWAFTDSFLVDGSYFYRTNNVIDSITRYPSLEDIGGNTNGIVYSLSQAWGVNDEFFTDGTNFYRAGSNSATGTDAITTHPSFADLVANTNGVQTNLNTNWSFNDQFTHDGQYFLRTNVSATGQEGVARYASLADLASNNPFDSQDFTSGGNPQEWSFNDDIYALGITAGFTVSTGSLVVDENAGTGSLTVVLDAQPSTDVVFDISSDDTGEATVSPATLTFTNSNWDVAQSVIVTGVNDAVIATHTGAITISIDAALSDNPFDTLADETVSLTFTNDDVGPTPGGISSNLGLWLKADEGVFIDGGVNLANDGQDIQQWIGQSINSHVAEQTIISNQPNYSDAALNFNPSIVFDSSNTEDLELDPDADTAPQTADDYTIIAVGIADSDSSGVQTYYDASDRQSTANESVRVRVHDDTHHLNWGGNTLRSTAGTLTENVPFLVTHRYDTGVGRQIYTEGALTASDTQTNFNANDIFRVRVGSEAGLHYDGQLSELIFYKETSLDSTDRQQIESYLALKYGITLSGTGYLNTLGSTVYDLTAGYDSDVFGIAKDDAQELDQRISKSVNSGSILTVSTDTDFTSENTAHADTLTDGQYLVIGNNGSGTITQTTELFTTLYQDRLSREWRVENTNSVGTVNLSFDGFDDSYVLLTDSDGDFLNGATNEGALSASGAITLTLDDGEFFTLARPAASLTKGLYFYPGGELDFTQGSASVEMTNINRRASSLSIIQTFNNDGTKMFIANEGFSGAPDTEDRDGRVSEYSLGVPYDVSTQSFVERHNIYPNLTTVPGTVGDSRIIRDISFSPDGLKLFVLNHNNSSIIHLQEYALTAPFDLSTLAVGHISSRNLSDLGSCDSNFRRAFQWANGGTKLYATGDSDICQFTTTIPYSVAGLSYETRLNASSFVYNSVYVSEDGKRLFTSEGNDGDNSDVLYYTLDTPFDISTTRFIATIDTADIGATESFLYGYRFRANPGETKLYLNPSVNVNSPFEIREFTLKPDNLRESDANDGSIDNSDPLLIRLIGEAFSDGDNDDILDPASYTVNNLPVGLTAVLTLSESDTAATLSLSGNATDHSWDDDVDEITFEFTDAAFAGGDAGAVFHSGDGSPVSVGLGIGIDFGDTPAGVNSNLRLWLNPDYGVNDDKACDGTLPADGTDTDCWQDLSLNSFTAIQDSGTNPVPDYIANSTNFNPGFSFNGSDEYWSVENVAGTNLGILREETFADAHVYAVFTAEDNNNTLFNEDTGEDDFGFFPYFNGGSDRHFWYAGDSGGSDDERLQVDTAGVGVGEPALMTLNSRTSSNIGQTIRRNGIDLITDTTADTIKGIDDELNIGVEQGGSDYLEGTINELIIFTGTGVHDAVNEQRKIESYLAVKYGITLDASSNDYVNSAGSSVYTLTGATSVYSNDVFGIARDDLSLLDQRISRSVNNDSILIISTDTDFTSANATHTGTLTDGQYLMIGNNGGNTATGTTDLDTAIYDSRVNREWRVENTNSVGTINLSFDGFNDDYVLLTDSDGDFSSGATSEGRLSASGAIALTLNDGEFFTLASGSNEAPGGVGLDLALWLKAEDGVNWTDQSGNSTILSSVGTPIINVNSLNFNDQISFNGSSRYNLTNASFANGTGDKAIYVVANRNTNSGAIYAATIGSGNANRFISFGHWENFLNDPFISTSGFEVTSNDASWAVNTPAIVGYALDGGSDQLYTNSTSLGIAQDDVSVNLTNGNLGWIGAFNNGAAQWSGDIAEVLVYNQSTNSNTDRQQIESYLALKYGITLSGTGYLNTLGSTVYDLTAGYDSDVFGIAKDDAQELDQRISKSVNSGSILTVSTDTDFTSANTTHADTLTDGQYLVIGNNGGATATQTGELNPIYENRIEREWRVENTNSVGAVNLSFDGFDDDYVLLTDSDGDFSSGATNEGSLSASGTISLTLDDGEFFTLATLDTTAPTVTFNQASTQSDPETGTGVVNFTATFSEPIDVSSFTCDDISTSGTATVTCTDITEVSGGNVFNVELTATTDGTVLTLILPGVVTDPAGNVNTLSNSTDNSVTVTGVFDNTPPVITITGSGVISHLLNNIYIDAGATCTDDVDVTCSTTASGIVDGFTLGVYTIDYNATDTAGNNAIIQTRTINVIDSLTDTDGDSVPDVIEIEQGTSPTNSGSFLDTDGDSAPDFVDPDDDGDGSIDSIEAGAPNGGDFNNDGLVDVLQQDVATIVSSINSEYVALDTTSGSCASASFNMIAESSLGTQSEREFPLGLADFSLNCSSTGATANIKVYYDKVYDTSTWEYQKYNATLNTYTDISSIVSYTTETVGSGSVTVANYSVTDGGVNDEDGIANRVIVDPSGPTIPTSSSSTGGGRTYSCRDESALNYRTFGFSKPELCEYADNVIAVGIQDPVEKENILEESVEDKGEAENTEVNSEQIIEEISNKGEELVEQNYTLLDDYSHCSIVSDINNSEYDFITDRYSDLEGSAFISEINKFSQIGVINGYEDGTFGPQNTITRTEFLKIVLQTHCLEYSDISSEGLDYIDVDASSWQARVISKAKELEIINGDVLEIDRDLIDTNLGRQYSLDRITELQRVFSVLGLYEGDIDGYYDDEFIDAVYDFQVTQGIMSSPYDTGAGFWGEQTRGVFFELYSEESYPIFRPNDTISKAEAIKILFNLSNIEAIDSLPLSYTDITVGWHEKYVQTGEALGLFDSQKDNGFFYPESGVKREEMIDLVNRLIQLY